MRFFTLLATFLLAGTMLSAQAVVVNSPESIAGFKLSVPMGFGADVTSDIWTADAVFVNAGGANPTQGCTAPINAAELAGKIALIDRGSCEFGTKCLRAQEAGAIAAIMFVLPGQAPFAGGPGAEGGNVTIPCFMMSYEDGQAIRAALETGAVNISLGNIVFGNNLAVARTGISNAPLGVVPVGQINAGEFIFTPAATVTNVGFNNAANVTVSATINHSSAGEVYNESASSAATVEPDSASGLILLPTFDPFSTGQGIYTVRYDISSDSTDEVVADNSITTDFTVSDNYFCKGGWDFVNNRPTITNAYTISGGGNIEFLAPFLIRNGENVVLDSVIFYISTAAPNTIGDIAANVFVYEWIDTNADNIIDLEEITIVALVEDIIYPDPAATFAWVRAPLTDITTFTPGYPVPADNIHYLVGVRYQGDQLVFFGFDENQDYTQYINIRGNEFTDAELPYIGINAFEADGRPSVGTGFLFTGLRAAVATSLVTKIVTNTDDLLTEAEVQLNVFPNPTSELLVADLKLQASSDVITYQITDLSGRTLFTARKNGIQEDRAEFNVSALPSGQYYLIVRTQEGLTRKAFTVAR